MWKLPDEPPAILRRNSQRQQQQRLLVKLRRSKSRMFHQAVGVPELPAPTSSPGRLGNGPEPTAHRPPVQQSQEKARLGAGAVAEIVGQWPQSQLVQLAE
uniref:(northern house mosquito) hypothetical protein n=1 Tax=Culex pipiens TaxID=7175 RepID=A0A8D8GG80_CULPI